MFGDTFKDKVVTEKLGLTLYYNTKQICVFSCVFSTYFNSSIRYTLCSENML